MTTGLRRPLTGKLADETAERARVAHENAIVELQQLPGAQLKTLGAVALADATPTPIFHGLGRVPMHVFTSPPRGPASAGRLEEVRDGTQDRTKVLVLMATGWGATITVDVAVL